MPIEKVMLTARLKKAGSKENRETGPKTSDQNLKPVPVHPKVALIFSETGLIWTNSIGSGSVEPSGLRIFSDHGAAVRVEVECSGQGAVAVVEAVGAVGVRAQFPATQQSLLNGQFLRNEN
jgi:hypothetical protein